MWLKRKEVLRKPRPNDVLYQTQTLDYDLRPVNELAEKIIQENSNNADE